jgi:hypothetical protein
VSLPASDTADWVLFGGRGDARVIARSAASRSLIDASRLTREGVVVRGSPNQFLWTGGRPAPSGSDDTDRLRLSGPAVATLAVTRTARAHRLALYVGGPRRLRIVVASAGDRTVAFTLALPAGARQRAPEGIVTIDLTGPATDGTATVAVTDDDGRDGFTLAAAVLH